VITSSTNPRIKRLVALRDRRDRDNEGVFVCEGPRAVSRLLAARRSIAELYVDRSGVAHDDVVMIEQAASSGATIVEVSPEALAKASYRDAAEGLLAVCPQWSTSLASVQLNQPNPLVLVVERVEKPGNLGAILRTADATGCDAVVVCDPVVDVFNPNVIRASTGVVFSLPLAVGEPDQVATWLAAAQLQLVATTPDTSLLHWEADLTGPTAILMGAEDVGLTRRWIDAAHQRVRLPMAGQADSLNVGVATAVVLYEAVRQRSANSPAVSV
jgi:RNA methyltransferase, TrmH family